MKRKTIVIAPDSFKGTLSAKEVCKIIKAAFLSQNSEIDIITIPVADGGEGTVDALLSQGGKKIGVTVKSPLNEDIEAFFGIMPDNTAVIEMAAASGLPLAGKNKNPLYTTTYGTGQLIKAAAYYGCKKILIGIGGSATNDGGVGCLAALGVEFSDISGKEIPLNGAGLSGLSSINTEKTDKKVLDCSIKVLCDVTSPLYGINGAAYVFAPQKGADKMQVEFLDLGLRQLAKVAKDKLGTDYSFQQGAGAAGGLGFSLMAFLGAELVPGAQSVLNALNFSQIAQNADLVVTGEGKLDSQSLLGKVPAKVKQLAGKTEVIAIVGSNELKNNGGFCDVFVANLKNRSFEEVKLHCREDLHEAAVSAAKKWLKK